MNGTLVVILAAAATWLILRGIRDGWAVWRRYWRRSSWLSAHERDVAYRQRDREIRESRRIGWKQ